MKVAFWHYLGLSQRASNKTVALMNCNFCNPRKRLLPFWVPLFAWKRMECRKTQMDQREQACEFSSVICTWMCFGCSCHLQVTKTEFLLTISIQNQADKWQQWRKNVDFGIINWSHTKFSKLTSWDCRENYYPELRSERVKGKVFTSQLRDITQNISPIF